MSPFPFITAAASNVCSAGAVFTVGRSASRQMKKTVRFEFEQPLVEMPRLFTTQAQHEAEALGRERRFLFPWTGVNKCPVLVSRRAEGRTVIRVGGSHDELS